MDVVGRGSCFLGGTDDFDLCRETGCILLVENMPHSLELVEPGFNEVTLIYLGNKMELMGMKTFSPLHVKLMQHTDLLIV